MKIQLRKSLSGHNNLFEWSVNGKTWYKINYKRIVAEGNGNPDPFKALEPFRDAMNKMRKYVGFFASVFEGVYDNQAKLLRVKGD